MKMMRFSFQSGGIFFLFKKIEDSFDRIGIVALFSYSSVFLGSIILVEY